MRTIAGYLWNFVRSVRPVVAAAVLLFTGLLVWTNYYFGLERALMDTPTAPRLLLWWLLFAVAFAVPVWLQSGSGAGRLLRKPGYLVLLLAAPLIFALKLALPLNLPLHPVPLDNRYWNLVLYYPAKLLLTVVLLYVLWRRYHRDAPFYGTGAGGSLRPYWGMLLFMVPLVALASTQADFLATYPKFQHLAPVRAASLSKQLLYELSYGSDFITIELFFRGFLVLAFARYLGTGAVLPMAVFYCAIHFGKPLGECISSFFGGIVLGVATFHSRSIWGGLLVHLGIAWLMELGGYLGRLSS
ncbi:CPBP family intramembrane glutamic endopeptidase [Flaviaesturariibacter amylovorans]|uniref:CAAX prenyl protease 2/Lysostaphin resistance protein A-like domain-containing protein n=1 Tax=Flaviaesturariibacter amylovorans TaxID=1084520 RepID=A0ABP8GXC2_9BACT